MGRRQPARNKKKLRAKRRMIALKGECAKCGSKERLTIDHIISLANGGSQAQSNWQVLCFPCNQDKRIIDDGITYRASPPIINIKMSKVLEISKRLS